VIELNWNVLPLGNYFFMVNPRATMLTLLTCWLVEQQKVPWLNEQQLPLGSIHPRSQEAKKLQPKPRNAVHRNKEHRKQKTA